MKESNTIELLEYTVVNRIVDKLAFAWWVPNYSRKRDSILDKSKYRYWKRKYNFGVELTKTFKELY